MMLNLARQFKPDDFPRLAEFIKTQFHDKYIISDFDFFTWQFRKNPVVEDFTFFVLEKDGVFYGNIGVVPLDYKVGGQTARLNTYVNLFVDPRVRSLGFGTLLIKKALAQGSPAVIGGYNPNSFSIYRKLGAWEKMDNFYRYVLIFDRETVVALLPENVRQGVNDFPQSNRASLAGTDLQFENISGFDSNFDDFWDSIKGKYAITVARTSSYLNWRYANHPYLDYTVLVAKKDRQIVGFVIWRIESAGHFSIARIIDFISQDEWEDAFLQKFAQEAKEKGAVLADFMFSGRYYHQALQSLGFFSVYGTVFEHLPMYFNPLSYGKNYINFAVWSDKESINKELFYNKDNWYLTKGDGDQDRPNPH